MNYDVGVIGNDEAAVEMACLAAAAGQVTVAVLPESRHSEWMVAQGLRHLVTELLVNHSEARSRRMQSAATPGLLRRVIAQAMIEETRTQAQRLEACGVRVLLGESRFQSAGTLCVSSGLALRRQIVHAQNLVIGTGVRATAMHRSLRLMPFSTIESLFEGRELPRQVTLLGGGDVAAGLTAVLQLFGVRCQWIADDSTGSVLTELAHEAGVKVVAADHRNALDYLATDIAPPPGAHIIDCRRCLGFTENLNLSAIGVEADENGQLWCNESLETWCSGVFAIGAVVGFTSGSTVPPTRQAGRILNRLTHRIRRPHFLRDRRLALAKAL